MSFHAGILEYLVNIDITVLTFEQAKIKIDDATVVKRGARSDGRVMLVHGRSRSSGSTRAV
jgi:hypothetical protein